MIVAISNTSICNMSLDKLGAARINDLDADQSPQAIKCRTHFEQTRDALTESHTWRFASGRKKLSQDTVDPGFEYDNQFILPDDYMVKKSVWGENGPRATPFSYSLEGDRLLTNESEINLRYIKRVTDPTKFDPLFVEVFILKLALKLVALAGANPKMTETIGRELNGIMPKVRVRSSQETENIGRQDLNTWNNARQTNGGRIDSRLGN
jgi:hypothetical protein